MKITITENQFKLLQDLSQRKGLDLISKTVKGVILAPFQTFSAAFAYIVKAAIISLDTGLGKTLIAASLINMSRAKNPNMRWIYLCQASNVTTTASKLQSLLYNAKVVYTTADTESLLRNFVQKEAMDADVLILTYNNILLPLVNSFVYNHRQKFNGIIADESHIIGNGKSTTASIVSGMVNCMEYKYFLTATPLRINADQIIHQVQMIDRNMFDGMDLESFIRKFQIREEGKVVGYTNLEVLQDVIFYRYISWTREELGMKGNYNTQLILCEPKPSYQKISKMDTFRVIKGDPDGPALKELIKLVKHRSDYGEQGLIYINITDNKKLVYDTLKSQGIRVGIMDGHYTSTGKKKDKVHQQFLNKELDVLITNVVTGKDLPCDYICFYELTFDFKQMLGRGERGLAGKDLEIIFIIVKGTSEVSYFYDNVYMRGILLKNLCQKDVAELEQAEKLLEMNATPYDLLEILKNEDKE